MLKAQFLKDSARRLPAADFASDWWWKPALLSSSLVAVVFVHWLILR